MSVGRLLLVPGVALALASPAAAELARVTVDVPGVMAHVGVPAAQAQETMEFTPVPEESVRALERRGVTNAPAAPKAPAAPARPQPLSRAGDVMRIGSDIHVEKDQVVEGDVFALQGDVRVDGHVRGNVASTGGDVYLGPNARVDGDVLCVGGQLHEEPGAWVGGQRVTALHGDRDRQIGRRLRDRFPGSVALEYVSRIAELFGAVIWLLVWMAVAWGVTRFAPRHTGTAVATLEREPGMSLLIGFLAALLLAPSAVAMALVVAILCITIIGIPLGVGVVLAYAALLVVLTAWGLIVALIPVGKRVAGRALGGPWRAPSAAVAPAPSGSSWAAVTPPSGTGMVTVAGVSLTRAAILGVVLVNGVCVASQALDLIPFMGWLGTLLRVVWWIANALLVMIGAGALLRSKFGQGSEGQWWPVRKPAPAVLGVPPAPVETASAPPTA